MNEMDSNNRDYRNSDYRNYRDYDNRYYDENIHGNMGYRENYRDDMDYRDYDQQDYYEELEMTMHEMKETSRKLEDVADMAENQQDKNMLMKIAQKEKENYSYIKQLVEK